MKIHTRVIAECWHTHASPLYTVWLNRHDTCQATLNRAMTSLFWVCFISLVCCSCCCCFFSCCLLWAIFPLLTFHCYNFCSTFVFFPSIFNVVSLRNSYSIGYFPRKHTHIIPFLLWLNDCGTFWIRISQYSLIQQHVVYCMCHGFGFLDSRSPNIIKYRSKFHQSYTCLTFSPMFTLFIYGFIVRIHAYRQYNSFSFAAWC